MEAEMKQAMDDRECLIAIMKGIAAVYRALTKEPLSIRVETANGVITITESGLSAGQLGQPADLPES